MPSQTVLHFSGNMNPPINWKNKIQQTSGELTLWHFVTVLLFPLFYFILFGLLACSNHSDIETNHDNLDSKIILADTCNIEDSLASEPFLFKSWNVSLDSVLMFLPSLVVLERYTSASEYHENTNDSTTQTT